MKYLTAGADGKLAGRVAAIMWKEIKGKDLILTCPDLSRVSSEKNGKKEELR